MTYESSMPGVILTNLGNKVENILWGYEILSKNISVVVIIESHRELNFCF